MDDLAIFNNRYQLLAKIGQGGLAEVYRAQDVALGRLVAVKALRHEYVADPSFLVRFHREAQSAASLTHPNIVAVYDFGQDQGRPYIVMEYVPGLDLRTVFQEQGGLSFEQAVDTCLQICDGVGYAHRSGLVHGDLKPGNVLVTPDGRVKVTDFGLARALGESAMDEDGELVWGTPAYFSPEQAAGGQVVPATDVYAIGVMLYEMLTGRLPFSGSDVEVAQKHLYEAPIPVDQVNPRVPSRLARIVDIALKKQPEDRFVTADQMGHALIQFRQVAEGYTGFHKPVGSTGSPVPEAGTGEADSSSSLGMDWMGLILGFLAVVAVAGLIPLWLTVFRTYGHREPDVTPVETPTLGVGQVRMPDVVGMEAEDARQVLGQVNLNMELVGQTTHPTIPAFAIVEQSVQAGVPVVEGATIGVVVSQGPDLVEVPMCAGRTLGEAQSELQSRGLVAETHQAWSEETPGVVVEQDPLAGSLVESGSRVLLVVSSGRQVPVGARLGEGILLVSYELPQLAYRPGDMLPMNLIWQSIKSPGQSYIVSVDLTGADGSVVAQQDGVPANGAHPTNTWSSGELIVDVHQLGIPLETAPGEYWLRVGMYGQSGQLPVSDAGQANVVEGALVLQSIQVN